MSVEEELLLTSVRRDEWDKADQIATEFLAMRVDWDQLINLAQRNGVLPRLYVFLSDHCSDIVPEQTLAWLEGAFRQNAWSNLVRFELLARLVGGLEEQGIRTITYKGPIMTGVVGKDLASRQFADLDVFVEKNDFSRASRWLEKNGFSCLIEESCQPSRNQASRFEKGYERKFLHNGTNTVVEVHWRFAPESFPVELNLDGLWQRAARVNLAGREFLSFAPDDLFLILTVHLANHCWRGTEQLKWICDLDDVIRTQPLEWTGILSVAKAIGCQRVVLLGANLANQLSGTPLPAEISQCIGNDRTLKKLSIEVTQQIFAESTGVRRTGVRRLLFYLRLRELWRHKARRAAQFAFSKVAAFWAGAISARVSDTRHLSF